MAAIQYIPMLFEYYSAICLTKQFQIRFYAYQDIPESHKNTPDFQYATKELI